MARIDRSFALAGLLCTTLCMPAMANDPLSAIEWLEKRPKQIVVPLSELPQAEVIDEAEVAGSVVTPQITVSPLGAPARAAAGLLPSNVTGLPRTLWQGSDVDTLNTLMTALDVEQYPALQSLLYTLLLAEADPPQTDQGESFIKTRVQKLLDLGALDPATALLERADPEHVELFGLYLDVALLNGDAEAPCAALRAKPSLSRDFAPRIYCDALGQNWDNAALMLATADAIGALKPLDVALLEGFLDPELFDTVPPVPQRPTVLQFRLFEAIGESLPTSSLPREFTATDLAGDAGWKAQLDAAERLARVGAISENRLLGIYASRIPSASGGIWDRVETMQRLETALKSGDPTAILKQLKRAWAKVEEIDLEVPIATLFADALLRVPSTGADTDLISRIALLSPDYESVAQRDTDDPILKVAQSIAIGEPKADNAVAISAAIEAGFSGSGAPARLSEMVADDRLGEAILRAMALTASGAAGDAAALQSGLAFLRSVGLEDTARRTALQVLLLGQRDQG